MTDAEARSSASSRTFAFDGARFVADLGNQLKPADLDPDTYILRKSERTIEFYRSLARRKPRRVLELGMFHGGSMVLWDKLFEPETLVGVDARAKPIEPLERYRADRPHVRAYYGRNPDKPGTVMAARESFPDGIDLVIDDATHRYDATRQAFENLFPLLRLGGTYVVEAWSWAHRPAAQRPAHGAWDQPALTNLIFELTVLAATNPVIESIQVEEGLFAVRKGPGRLPEAGITSSLVLRGREMSQI